MSKGTRSHHLITPRRAGTAGVVGTLLFAATLVFLTIIEYEFMLSIGWEPWSNPGDAWPSGLALGPYGWVMNASFVVSGAFFMVFAVGLRGSVSGGLGTVLLFVSGFAMAMMAFETDPIMREGPRSIHGWIHDVSFIIFAISLLVSMFFLWREFRKSSAWETRSRYTLSTGISAIVFLLLPGVAYYLFVAVLLVWLFVTAMKLWRSDPPNALPTTTNPPAA